LYIPAGRPEAVDERDIVAAPPVQAEADETFVNE
jgi:hypothetical protein